MAGNTSKGVKRQQNQESTQDILNQSYDPAFATLVSQIAGSPDGTNMYKLVIGADGSAYVTLQPTATRTDSLTTSNVTYIGSAVPGSLTSDPVWQISKIDKTTAGVMVTTWADGNAQFDNVWDNRASLTFI
jgi:hypothetical protein